MSTVNASDDGKDTPNMLMMYFATKIVDLLKDEETKNFPVTINKMLASEGNKEIINVMRDKLLKITLEGAIASTKTMKRTYHHEKNAN